jgi:16S rRNA (cytosine967-C5)-methyltransferase
VVKAFRKKLEFCQMPVSPARAAAFDILRRVERQCSYASELLHSKTYAHLNAPDQGLTTELVMGVLRWQSRLDHEIATASNQSLSKLDLEILIALRLGIYQFRWLDRIPKRAALNESVELVKRARKKSAAPFVNAVLRKLATNPAPTSPQNIATPEALARELAHPEWLVNRWTGAYGFSAASAICQYDQSVPGTAIRLRDADAEAQITEEEITLLPGRLLHSARLVTRGDVTKTRAVWGGKAVIQDEASQLIPALLGAGPGPRRILDCCAAPGGKTLAIADRNPESTITAVEIHPHRARLLKKLLRPANTKTPIQVLVADAQHLLTANRFDRVLADVPCSGTGTLARNPEIKWRLKPDDLPALHSRQLAILRAAMSQVIAGGRLLYSTCSLENEENEEVIEQALTEDKSFRRIDCGEELNRLKAAGELIWRNPTTLTQGPYLRTIPGIHPCDGFFAAILERS